MLFLVALCFIFIHPSFFFLDFGWRELRACSLFALLSIHAPTRAPSVISSPLIMYALAISSCAHICRPERERPSCPRNQNIYDIYVMEGVRPGSCSKQGRLCIRVSMHHLLHRQCATWVFRLRTGNGRLISERHIGYRNCKDL